jgi:hypothetical protein
VHGEQKTKIELQSQAIAQLEREKLRTPAEEHRFKETEAALLGIDPRCPALLRHLLTRGTLTLNSVSPSPCPKGMDVQTMSVLLGECEKEHLVFRKVIEPNRETEYAITPGTKAALEELLYRDPV